MNVLLLSSIGTELGAPSSAIRGASKIETLRIDLENMIQGGSTTIWGASKILTYEDGDLKAQHVLVPSESMPTRTPLFDEDDKLKRLRQTAKIITVHYSKSLDGDSFRNGFVISANGTTLRTREFDLRYNLRDGPFELSCAEGLIKASSFTVKPDEDALRTIHPALVDTPSTVLHHFGVDPRYAKWRSHLKAKLPAPQSRNTRQLTLPGGSIVTSQRNSPPLFGLGLIEALPDQVLFATAAQEAAAVRGRVNTMKSGRIGKFGWKAQTTSLREFVLAPAPASWAWRSPDIGRRSLRWPRKQRRRPWI